jgi:hypothetical protein
MATNLPITETNDSGAATKLFFDSYGNSPLEFNANDYNFTVSFFEKKGFDKDAALVVTSTLLKQAKIDGTPIAQILDTLKDFTGMQMSQLVGEILNNNRTPTSTLGFRAKNIITNQNRHVDP